MSIARVLISASLLFSCPVLAFGACSINDTVVTCDNLDETTLDQALALIMPGREDWLKSFYPSEKQNFASQVKAYTPTTSMTEYLILSSWTPALQKTYDLIINDDAVTSTSLYTYFDGFYAQITGNNVQILGNWLWSNAYVSFETPDGTRDYSASSPLQSDILVDAYNIAAVPGPEAGAGLTALIISGVALCLKRRCKEEAKSA